jgi:hypothetical protein
MLDVIHGKSEDVSRAIQLKPGVVMADVLEGPPDVMLVIEAPDRKRLAEFTTSVLAQVETITEKVDLLPVQNGKTIYE